MKCYYESVVFDCMDSLTVEMVIQIHDFLIGETGGLPGIRDPGTLYFLVEEINYEGDVFRKAANALFLADSILFGMVRRGPLLNWRILFSGNLAIVSIEVIKKALKGL